MSEVAFKKHRNLEDRITMLCFVNTIMDIQRQASLILIRPIFEKKKCPPFMA